MGSREQRMLKRLLVIGCTILFTIIGARISAIELQQANITATPVPVNLPSPLPFVTPQVQATATPEATWTSTPQGPVMLEALTEANVRAQADTESERLGTIRAGDLYPIIGRYFRWYQFQYDQSPTGTGWVFDELVRIIGDESSITDLTLGPTPTLDTNALASTGTLLAITQTPGGVLTATAETGSIPLPSVSLAVTDSALNLPLAPEVLPTYTFPPNLPSYITPVPTDPSGAGQTPDEIATLLPDIQLPSNIPPILPIVLLGGGGMIVLLLTTYRRK